VCINTKGVKVFKGYVFLYLQHGLDFGFSMSDLRRISEF